MSDQIECRTCGKMHGANDTCPAVKEFDSIEIIFCQICGCHYTNGCPNHISNYFAGFIKSI